MSVLTIVRGRPTHLHNQLRGLRQSNELPVQWIVVGMDQDVQLPTARDIVIQTSRVDGDGSALPLAAARNLAAALCQTEGMIFLDVDCIPLPTMISQFQTALSEPTRLWMGCAKYLPADANRPGWQMDQFEQFAVTHPLQPNLRDGQREPSLRYELFWSLCFAITQTTFKPIGGFDENFDGYGGEDTDFAFSIRAAAVPFGFVGAIAYHQHHPVCKPPLNHFNAIVRNAIRFMHEWVSEVADATDA